MPRTPPEPPAKSPPAHLFGGERSTPVRLAYGLVPLVQLLEAREEAPCELLTEAEIPRFALVEPSYRISLPQELSFTRMALARLGDDVALEVGRRFHLSMFRVLGFAVACAPGRRRFMPAATKFSATSLQNPFLRCHRDGVAQTDWQPSAPDATRL